MSDFIVSMAGVMRAEVDTLSTIAQNSANINTPGYKSIRSILTSPDSTLNKTQTYFQLESKINSDPGQIKITNEPLDFAITAEGWFAISKDEEVFFTRNGNFKVSPDGYLTTQSGDFVLGEDGPIQLSSEIIGVGNDGSLIAADDTKIKLSIYKINDHSLSSVGHSLYSANYFQKMETGITILQGAVEASNVDAASDMVRIMESTRHIESIQRAINTYNELLNAGINEIGK